MDIRAIQDNIEQLENSATTFDNVQELASLYIVRAYLENSNLVLDNRKLQEEFDDILPQYRNYVDVKRRYQIGEASEQELKKYIKILCQEIYEFIYTLYHCTDMKAERNCITNLIENLSNL